MQNNVSGSKYLIQLAACVSSERDAQKFSELVRSGEFDPRFKT